MRLETERLVLREFEETDWAAVLAYQVEPRYLRYYEWTERRPEDVREFVQRFISQQQENPRTKFQLTLVLKSSNQLIGNCGIRLSSADARQADLGYELERVPLSFKG